MLRHCAYVVVGLLVLTALLMSGLVTKAGEDAWIRGTVLDPEGRALPGAEVSLRVPEGRCRFVPGTHVNGRSVTDENGRFVLPTPPGEMEVYVRHAEHAPAWTVARDGALVELEVASWVEGRVYTPATITITRGPWRFVHERVEGAFRCGPLPADQVLSLGATSGTHRPFAQRVLLRRGETLALDVTLERGAELTGRVLPPHEGATIRAHGRDGHESVATTAADGTFTVTGLEAGWVRLVVISPDRPLQVLDARTGDEVEVRWPR